MNEDAFLAALLPTLPQHESVIVPPGDDCAAIALDAQRVLLIAADQLVAGTHYLSRDSDHPTPPELAGRKLLARNLSDIAAMGGKPTYALLTLAVDAETSENDLLAYTSGITELANQHGVSIVGGDVGRGPGHVGSLTILGEAHPDRLMLRSQAQAGDLIMVTGCCGRSFESDHHLHFLPRLAEGQWLAKQGCRCAIDLSDGLIKDLTRLCTASHKQAIISGAVVPLREKASLEQALYDGEDYELLFAVSPAYADQIRDTWPFETRLTTLGSFRQLSEQMASPVLINSEGKCSPPTGKGFTHFD